MSNLKKSISPNFLLGLFSIAPLALLVAIADRFLFGERILNFLPRDPEQMRLFTGFFILPHIVASSLSFFDREYLAFYKSSLLKYIPLICFVCMVPTLLWGDRGFEFTFLIYSFWNIYHVLTQQLGISRILLKRVSKSYTAWKWLIFIIGILLYSRIYPAFSIMNSWHEGMKWAIFALVLPTVYLSHQVARQSLSTVGRHYVWANLVLLVIAILLFEMRYFFLSILLPRVIHDLTAYHFYFVHDHNRNESRANNFLFGALNPLKLPWAWLGPIWSIIFANLLMEANRFGLRSVGLFTITVSAIHFYTEAISWKGPSLHRKQISVDR